MMSVTHSASTTTLLVRVLVTFALTFVLGFERELRGFRRATRPSPWSAPLPPSSATWPALARRTPSHELSPASDLSVAESCSAGRSALARWSTESPRRRPFSRPPRLARRLEPGYWLWPRWRRPGPHRLGRTAPRITAISDGAEQPAGIPARANWERMAVPAQNTH